MRAAARLVVPGPPGRGLQISVRFALGIRSETHYTPLNRMRRADIARSFSRIMRNCCSGFIVARSFGCQEASSTSGTKQLALSATAPLIADSFVTLQGSLLR